MPSPTLRPVAEMPSPTDWMAPPTAEPAPATVVSTAVQKGSRRPMVYFFLGGGGGGWFGLGGKGGGGGGEVVGVEWCCVLVVWWWRERGCGSDVEIVSYVKLESRLEQD